MLAHGNEGTATAKGQRFFLAAVLSPERPQRGLHPEIADPGAPAPRGE